MIKVSTEAEWLEFASKKLLGKTIQEVFYMSEDEAKEAGWFRRPIILSLSGGTFLVAMSDNEGNNGGALDGVEKDGSVFKLPAISERWT